MPTPPDFDLRTKDLLAQRSAMICNNPDCLSLTVGPDDAAGDMAVKLGEAAHIRAARSGQARFDATMTEDERATHMNGIWLCRNCHALIDKNGGVQFPRATIESWKKEHTEMIELLLRSHKSPIAKLRKMTKEGRIAQIIVDIAEQHGALFANMALENADHVIQSVKTLRGRYNALIREIEFDKTLKAILQQLSTYLRDFMNLTSLNPAAFVSELHTLRNRLGQLLRVLRDNYGCKIPPNLTIIVPN